MNKPLSTLWRSRYFMQSVAVGRLKTVKEVIKGWNTAETSAIKTCSNMEINGVTRYKNITYISLMWSLLRLS